MIDIWMTPWGRALREVLTHNEEKFIEDWSNCWQQVELRTLHYFKEKGVSVNIAINYTSIVYKAVVFIRIPDEAAILFAYECYEASQRT